MVQENVSLETAIQLLEKAYTRSEYEKVLRLGKQILKQRPDLQEVKAMVEQTEMLVHLQQRKKYKWLAIGNLVLTLILAIFLMGQFWFVNLPVTAKLSSQEKSVLNLIQENGKIQDTGNALVAQNELLKSQVSMLSSSLHELSDRFTRRRTPNTDEQGNMIQSLQTKIDEQNNQIQKLMQLSIDQTQQKNSVIYGSNIQNVLILGENAGLTDTVMIAAINPSLKSISLISVPRDLYIDGRKINEIYRDFGADTLKVYLQDITGLTIEKYVKLDLIAFVKIIDTVGGIDLNVVKEIKDEAYPKGDGTTEILEIPAGWQHMDGALALKYARTRHGDSDFERAKRQQQVVEVTLDKINALGFTDLTKKFEIAQMLLSYVVSDMNVFEALGTYESAKDFASKGAVLSTTNYLYSTKSVNNDYILLPNDNTYKEIQQFVYDSVMQ